MASAIKGIDHCVILVRDLDVAHEKMSALGFTLTPRGIHSAHMGTANHCIMLRLAYFEVLSVRAPTDFNASWRDKLTLREGLDAVPIASDDVEAARAELMARGVELPLAIDFSRPVDLPEGPSEAAFRLVMIPEEHTPHITMFAIQHFTREVVWHPSYLDHPNGAQGVRGVTAVHERPAEVAPAYRKIFGDEAVTVTKDATQIVTGVGQISFLTPAHYAERFPGIVLHPSARPPYLAALSIDVLDCGVTAACLDQREIPYTQLTDGSVCVAPADACGTLLQFV
jgi:hypothetical protein